MSVLALVNLVHKLIKTKQKIYILGVMPPQGYSEKSNGLNEPTGLQLPLGSPLMGISRRANHPTISKNLVMKQPNITSRMKNVELKD